MAKGNSKDSGAGGGIDPQLAAQFQQFLAQQAQAAQPVQPAQPQLTPEQVAQLQALLAAQQAQAAAPAAAPTPTPAVDQAAQFQAFLAQQAAPQQPTTPQAAAPQAAAPQATASQPQFFATTPTAAPKKRRGKAVAFSIIGSVAALAVVAAALFAFGVIKLPLDSGEITLVAVGDQGPDPFSSINLAPNAPKLAPAVVVPVTATPIAADAPGLYGGTGDTAVCDAKEQALFLGQNPEKALAFVTALNKDPNVALADGSKLSTANLSRYITELTSVLLVSDTLVTNHGFAGGQPTTLQSVLQAGTAVMVDQNGVPRIKCNCGNPLLPPVVPSGTPAFVGKAWDGFTGNVLVITPSPSTITTFTTVDPTTGATKTVTSCVVPVGAAIPTSCVDPATVPAVVALPGAPAPDFTVTAGSLAPSTKDVSSSGNPRQYFGCQPVSEFTNDQTTLTSTLCLGGTVVRILDSRSEAQLLAQWSQGPIGWGGDCVAAYAETPYDYDGWTGTMAVQNPCVDSNGWSLDVIQVSVAATNQNGDRITASAGGSSADSAAIPDIVRAMLASYSPVN